MRCDRISFGFMKSVEDIKRAIEQLSVSDRQVLERWLCGLDDAWDRQIASDACEGKLDPLIREADMEIDGANQ